MIDSATLLADLKRELKTLEVDLRVRAEDESSVWGARLRDEYARATKKERTGLAWIDWRDGEVAQAGVAWIIASVFIRFCEDNGLLVGATSAGRAVSQPWIAAPGDGLERAVENEAAFYAATPTMTSRDWLQQAFGTLADLPAGGPLVDRAHSAVWSAEISATASDGLLAFFRRTTTDGTLAHDFSDPELGTRFLGDLYQDLSDYAKKAYALLQTPVFVEQFILDLTLTPAIKEFGLNGLKVIDPACGSGHFLLGAFDRLMAELSKTAPGMDKGARTQHALDSIHGVDLNPFAIAIARFRLTVAAIKAAGIQTLVAAPAFRYHIAIGDSLLGGQSPEAKLDMGDGEEFAYQAEDLREHANILAPGQYHVVVANPPYIQPPDAKLRDSYRARYSTCRGKYALSVPFMELLFRLAKQPDAASGAGYVGQITSNSFMKREFGKKLIDEFLSGRYVGTKHPEYVDLSHIIDTSGAYIPGHGTPTVIIAGRPRKPRGDTVRTVLGVRGEPSQPAHPEQGFVWKEIGTLFDGPAANGEYVSVAEMQRAAFVKFPMSMAGGGSVEVRRLVEEARHSRLIDFASEIGFVAVLGEEGPFEVPNRFGGPTTKFVVGDGVRDYGLEVDRRFWPYVADLTIDRALQSSRWLWPFRATLSRLIFFGKTPAQRGIPWYQYAFLGTSKLQTPISLSWAEIASHNHFVIQRSGEISNKSAPVVKLAADASEDDYVRLQAILNTSVACFWLKQVSYPKGGDPIGADGARVSAESWSDRYQFNATKLESFPLPADRFEGLASEIDAVARERAALEPLAIIQGGELSDLDSAQGEWETLRLRLVSLQEEMDWRAYEAYGVAGSELVAPASRSLIPIEPSARAFEIQMARDLLAGRSTTSWFQRHRRSPLAEVPEALPTWYSELVERRIEALRDNTALRVLEQPDFKRRWAGPAWNELLSDAAKTALLDRLEAPELWRDGSVRPLARSAAQVADALRHDHRVLELLAIHAGTQDFDLTTEVGKLLEGEAVPAFAPLRYKPTGIEKFRAWERTWELQRAEDRGEQIEVPVPPKYAQADFLKQTYWSARGKLDVPKERFLSFPGTRLPDDTTELYGSAGWDHAERGQAIARLANDVARSGVPDQQVIPLLGALIELQPWLDQWHSDINARSGVSPASAISGAMTALLGRLGIGADTVLAWRPAPATRGRKKA